jgi:hypothetical protein
LKIGAENKRKLILMVVLAVFAIALVAYRFQGLFSGGSASAAPSSVPSSSTRQPAKPATVAVSQPDTTTRLLLDVLENSRSVKYQEGRNIFSMEAPQIEKPLGDVRGGTPTPTPPPTPTPVPTPPPIPLKYYGFANKSGESRKIFLQEQGGEVFVASQGEIVARRYRVVQIQPNAVTMEDVITGNRQPVQLTVR